MHSISFSQYSTFKDCQHKWELVYGLGIREYLPGIDSILGTALHETLQYYLDVLYNNSNDDAADALDLSKILYNNMTKIDFLFIQLYIKKKYNKKVEEYFNTTKQSVSDWRIKNELPPIRLIQFYENEKTLDLEKLLKIIYKNEE